MSGDWTPAILAVICGTAISIGGFVVTHQYQRNVEERAFAVEATRHADAIQQGIKRYTDAVNALATFMTASNRIDRWEFLRFSNLTLDRYSGFSAFAWVPRVSHPERSAFEASAQRDGLFGLTIHESGSDGALVEAAKRLEYLPIAYLVPFEPNQDALSFDLGSDPRYRQVLDHAGDLGQLQATDALALPQVDQNAATVWLVLPLYARNSDLSDLLERRKALVGFAIGVLRLDAFVKDVLGNTDSVRSDLSVFDASDGANGSPLIALGETSRNRPAELRSAQGTTIEREFEVAGRRWLVASTVKSEKSFSLAGLLPWYVALIGALLTALLTQHLIASVVQRRTIEHVVRRRTAELSDRNEQLRSEVVQRQRTEMDLRAAKEQADSANRAKSEFLAMISHELRTPLNAIIGFSAMLSGEADLKLSPEASRGYAADIHRSGTHLLELINDILDLSRAEVGKAELNDALVDLRSVISSSVGMVRTRADETGIKLAVVLPSELPLLHADERKLKQILLNLISNALKFTPHGGTVSVAVVEEIGGDLIVTVSDTGIGIAQDEIERVFEPFVQLDSSLARKYEGTGLGLPLSRRWAQLHGGSLVLESELGAGTVARLWFPKERVRSAKVSRLDRLRAPDGYPAKRPKTIGAA
jgi:signal transduction histidine kinase